MTAPEVVPLFLTALTIICASLSLPASAPLGPVVTADAAHCIADWSAQDRRRSGDDSMVVRLGGRRSPLEHATSL